MKRETQKVIDKLRDSREPLETSELHHLSNLTREEQRWLDEGWNEIPLDKRRRLVRLMAERAEEDIQMDFTAVFRRGMRDEDAMVRRDSVEGLWEDESITLIRPLMHLLEDPDIEVQACAATALGRFVLQGELGYLSEERATELVECLVKITEDSGRPISVRRRAVEAVGYSGDERVRGIISRAYEEASVEMRASAIYAMGRSADESWRGQVRGELFSENPILRFEAARAAGELSDRAAVGRLIRLLEDNDREVREMAIWSLGQIGGEAAKEALKKLIRSTESPLLRQLAKDSLAELSAFDEEDSPLFGNPTLFPEEEEGIEFDDEWDEDEDIEWDEPDDDFNPC